MARGDVSYSFVTAGSSSASTALAYPLFGINNSLSRLNEDEVVVIQLTMQGAADFFVGPSGSISNNFGIKIPAGTSGIELPPMRVGDASALSMIRATSGVNPAHNYVVWARRP